MQALIHRDSKAWQFQVWVSFLAAAFLCGVGLAYLPGKDLDRAFMIFQSPSGSRFDLEARGVAKFMQFASSLQGPLEFADFKGAKALEHQLLHDVARFTHFWTSL